MLNATYRGPLGGYQREIVRRLELRNGVRGRIELHTGDMRRLPFPDASFDVITSSLAIHSIDDKAGREQALAEILRVLKPGGTALIADIRHGAQYARYLSRQPGIVVERRGLGWRFSYGVPHFPTTLVTLRRHGDVSRIQRPGNPG